MMLRNLQLAGGSPGHAKRATNAEYATAEYVTGAEPAVGLTRLAALRALGWNGSGMGRSESGHGALLYGAVALGLVTGAAVSAYLWKQRARALNLLQTTPFERAEELLASCEHKIEDIERAIDELKNASR